MVGIVGKAGAGKSTLAMKLTDLIPASAVWSLAAPVYDIAEILVGGSVIKTETYRVGSSEYTGRAILQHIGTEVGRALDEDVWLELLKRDVAKSSAEIVIVDDVRFLNEFEAMDVKIGLLAEGFAPAVREVGMHRSEAWADALVKSDECDMVLCRDGDKYAVRLPGKGKPTYKEITVDEIARMIEKAAKK